MASNQDALVRDLSRVKISNYTPQQYSPTGKKVAPVVPPKPKNDAYAAVTPKSNGIYPSSQPPVVPRSEPVSSTGGPVYSNYNISDDDIPPPPPPPPIVQASCYSAVPSQSYPPPPPPQAPCYSSVSSQFNHPAPPPHGAPLSSSTCQQQYAPLPPSDALLQSSSPASSTYGTQSGYATFRPQSSASSYDTSSIYEPITPRPPSQMSTRSTYSVGSGGSSLYSSYYPSSGRGKSTSGRSAGKEAEVDRLTDLMVQSMENSSDPDFFGMCYKCGEKVLGEGSGCTAMDHVYHINCFTCHVCCKELRGKPFYAKDGKPFCEDDYLNTLEKCCVCGSRILDRILRATGKPYHPSCFTCIVCGICLDGIPFTVDATNQIHCIDDFHKKFAPRCCVCKLPIMPQNGEDETVRVVALDRSFHIQCYRCEDCGVRLKAEVTCCPMDDHVLCRSCNATRVQALTSSMTTEL